MTTAIANLPRLSDLRIDLLTCGIIEPVADDAPGLLRALAENQLLGKQNDRLREQLNYANNRLLDAREENEALASQLEDLLRELRALKPDRPALPAAGSPK